MKTRRNIHNQPNLFNGDVPRGLPLADRVRPCSLQEFMGQEHLVGEGKTFRKLLEHNHLISMILWGPAGSGKTSLVRIISTMTETAFISISAVVTKVAEVRKIIEEAKNRLKYEKRKTILFIDEIHRFNKAQQDAFLPFVENGTIILIGATTENPSFEIISPLLSRCRVFTLKPLADSDLLKILQRAIDDTERGLGKEKLVFETNFLKRLVKYSNGDARVALNMLEQSVYSVSTGRNKTRYLTLKLLNEICERVSLFYDKDGEEHYNIISALHKSIRGSDPDASIYWLVRMLESGEDPLFIARRLVRVASEDIGLADPRALTVALAAKDAVQFVGMPESNLALAQATIYLACAPKSNSLETAYNHTKNKIKETGNLPVPLHLRNAPTNMMKNLGYSKGYRYPHDYEGAFVKQQYLPNNLAGEKFYEPRNRGFEKEIKHNMDNNNNVSEMGKNHRILKTYKKVAIVGLSANQERPSYQVAKYLISEGYDITPVNPKYDTILGIKSYPSLLDVPGDLEIVDVFRKPGDIMSVAEDAVQAGAKVFWMQLGIRNEEAAEYLEKNGVEVVQDLCMAIELRGMKQG